MQLNIGFMGSIKALIHLLGLPSYFRMAINNVFIHKDEVVVLTQSDEIHILIPF